ncbi:immediate early response 2a [Esox lucius]|uniref:Immediate early response gene 2 protein n=1 Tax=Esox lucius TaxID=8010 RepID=C1BXS0_ESOLU|nr:immediate early response gene 2 protein [Esox lucius]ACO13823.1 Immediate early response gene 2 protein [Esox lucius]
MEVNDEAKRILVQALGKLYSSRSQRGGAHLHRSLLLTLVMQSARDVYLAAQQASWAITSTEPEQQESPAEKTMDTNLLRSDVLCHSQPATPLHKDIAISSEYQTNSYSLLCSATTSLENKENLGPRRPGGQARKRRGKAAVEPDFLPCKKPKMMVQYTGNSVRRNSVKCNHFCGDYSRRLTSAITAF